MEFGLRFHSRCRYQYILHVRLVGVNSFTVLLILHYAGGGGPHHVDSVLVRALDIARHFHRNRATTIRFRHTLFARFARRRSFRVVITQGGWGVTQIRRFILTRITALRRHVRIRFNLCTVLNRRRITPIYVYNRATHNIGHVRSNREGVNGQLLAQFTSFTNSMHFLQTRHHSTSVSLQTFGS